MNIKAFIKKNFWSRFLRGEAPEKAWAIEHPWY